MRDMYEQFFSHYALRITHYEKKEVIMKYRVRLTFPQHLIKEPVIFNMAKIPEAQNRLFKNIFVCKKCQTKIRSNPQKILKGKVKCRKCKKSAFRTLKKK